MMQLSTDKTLANFKKKFELTPEKSTILILGLGITGLSIARFLTKFNFNFQLLDSRQNPPMKKELLAEIPPINLVCGDFENVFFSTATHLIVSPGISLDEPKIQHALNHGAILVSDIDLFALATDTPIIAITGSNGKSTVTTMLGEMGNRAGKKTAIGGNLGTAALNLLAEKAELYVLELSSFQLERTCVLNANSSTVLNISADHLDRHGTLASYAMEKQKVFQGNGVKILNADDELVAKMASQNNKNIWFSLCKPVGFHVANQEGKECIVYEDQALMLCENLPLEGSHNIANALAALALGFAVGLELDKMCSALKNFKGLEHRMQKVAHIKGVDWINDSKATNIGACIAALSGYDNKVILLAGGDAKGADMNELRTVIKEKTKSVILMGKDAPLIKHALEGCVSLYEADSMNQAVQQAFSLAHAGETVLLSPACASLDQYKNYQQRGKSFATAVMALG